MNSEREREVFVALADRCTEFIGMADLQLRPFYVNPAGLRLVGLDSLEQACALEVADYFFPEDQPFILNEFLPGVLRAAKSEVEIRFRHFKTGAAVWMIYNVFVLKDAGGEVIGLATFSQNITERKRVEEELRSTREELEKRVQDRTIELHRANESLRNLSARLLHIRDSEARRLARELHDSVGQMLAAMSMNIAMVERQSHNLDEDGAKAVAENRGLVEQISAEIRTISYLLHPPLLDELGLRSALGWYVEGFSERSKVKVELEISPEFGRLSSELEIPIFRVVQECLTNIHRHSGSNTALIRIFRENNQVVIVVQDWGKGIPAEKLSRMNTEGLIGVGFRGMTERLRHLGGSLTLHSDDTGTVVTARLPLAQAQGAAVS